MFYARIQPLLTFLFIDQLIICKEKVPLVSFHISHVIFLLNLLQLNLAFCSYIVT